MRKELVGRVGDLTLFFFGEEVFESLRTRALKLAWLEAREAGGAGFHGDQLEPSLSLYAC